MTGSLALQRTSPTDTSALRAPSHETSDTETIHAAKPLVRCFNDIEHIAADWRVLERDGTGAVYQRLEWCRVWLDTFCVPLNATPLIVAVYLAGRPAMLLPLYTRTSLTGMRRATFIGDKHANIRVPLTSTDADMRQALAEHAQSGALQAALVDAVRKTGQVDVVNLGRMPPAFGGFENLLYSADGVASSDQAFIGELSNDFTTLCSQRRGGVYRKKLRKKLRALEKFGEVRFEQACTAEQIDAALDVFFAQKKARLTEKRLDNAFNLADNRDFIRTLAHESARTGQSLFQLYTLDVGDTCASVFAGGSYQGAFSGAVNSITIDENLATRSPGEIIIHNLVETLCAQGLASFDLGLGDAQYKRSWCEPVDLYDVPFAITARGNVLLGVDKLKRKVRASLLANPKTAMAARQAKFYLKRVISRL